MTAEVDHTYKIDTRWPEYTPPGSAIAELVQRPLESITGLALADAYMRDERRKRRG
jgi:hypothetical protein